MRSDKQKEDPQYRQHRSLWYDIDEDKMYPEARGLMEQGFEPDFATMEILCKGNSSSMTSIDAF